MKVHSPSESTVNIEALYLLLIPALFVVFSLYLFRQKLSKKTETASKERVE